MADTSKLRWALYENVYQPALVFPPEELGDADLPAGHSVVYLLGLDSNVVVPESDVSLYDPRDAEKMSNPAAALGVALAQQILEGFPGGVGGDARVDLEAQESHHTNNSNNNNSSKSHHHHHHHDDDDEEGEADASQLRLLDDDEHDDSDDGRNSGDDGGDDEADARRRRHEEKKLRREERRKAKEAKKAARATVKREREELVSAPAIRHRDTSDSDYEDDDAGLDHNNSEDDDDALLAAKAIEKKYSRETNKQKAKTRSSSGKVKLEKLGEEEEDAGSGDPSHARSGKKKSATAPVEGSWAALEEDLFSDEESEDNGEEAGPDERPHASSRAHHGLRSGNRMGQALAALNATNASHSIPGLFGACPYAQPYLMEIHYEYEQLAQEAANEGLLLTLQEGEVVRAIDEDLRQKAAQKVYLEEALSARQHRQDAAAASQATNNEMDALYDAIAKLEAPLRVTETVRRLVRKQMPASAAAFDRTAAVRARRAVQRRTRTFQDTSVVTLVDHLRSVDAAPREDGVEVMRRYIQQRRQHEELKSNFRGLSKTGFYAVPKPLEKWRRARDMMMLANVGVEAQKVLPTSYISQAHSTMVRRMKEHAEKRYDRMPVTARDGASFLDSTSFTNNAMPSPSALSAGLTQQQQRLAASSASVQRREAFFQFHALRCDTTAPVTVETVALNADFAGTGGGLSQSVLASVGDFSASMASDAATVDRVGMNDTVNGGHVDDNSVQTDEGLSQTSYSVHSAAPSSYPYLFDSEPQPRRSGHHHQHHHRQRSSNASGLSSLSEGASSAVSSRAASVGSAVSGHPNDEENGEANEGQQAGGVPRRPHRRGMTSKSAASATAAAAAAATATSTTTPGASDWRANAKRSIMEQLTLYCRGRGGKPAILSTDQCREIGRTLLDRAMRAEAERQGVSLAVQSNNLAAPFTKTTEQRLKKSVDHYLERRIAQRTLPSVGGEVVAGMAEYNNNNNNGGVNAVLPMPGAATYDAAAAVARQRAVADTPVYEN